MMNKYIFHRNDEIILHVMEVRVYQGDIENDGAQNVHDTNVRANLWKKYDVIKEKVKELTKGYKEQTIYDVSHRMPEFLKSICNKNEHALLVKLVETIKKRSPVVDTNNQNHSEEEIFAYCYYYFRKLNLDKNLMKTQYLDCFSDNETLCLVGRISRYIGMFEGLIEGTVGETEETKSIIFQRALHEAKMILEEALNKDNEMRIIYNNESNSIDDEEKLCNFLNLVSTRVSSKLRHDYPKLSNEEVNNILIAIN